MSVIFSIWTVVALVLFLGIAVWAYSARRAEDFETAQRQALDLDRDGETRRDG